MRITKSGTANFEKSFNTVEGLAGVARRLIQEIEVLKRMLRDKGVWDEAEYKKRIMEQMIDDYNSAGCASELSHSYHAYTLPEESLLKYRFNLSDEDIVAFQREVDYVSTLT